MENYAKGNDVEQDFLSQLGSALPQDQTVIVDVPETEHDHKESNSDSANVERLRSGMECYVIWMAKGNAIAKAIWRVENVKRVSGVRLLQASLIRTLRNVSYFEPQRDGLQRLAVNVDVPAIEICLTNAPQLSPALRDAFRKMVEANEQQEEEEEDDGSFQHSHMSLSQIAHFAPLQTSASQSATSRNVRGNRGRNRSRNYFGGRGRGRGGGPVPQTGPK